MILSVQYVFCYLQIGVCGCAVANFDWRNAIVFDMFCSMEELNEVLPEGLPLGMMKEFEESCRSSLLVRQCFIDLRDNFRQAADPSMVAKSRGHFPTPFSCLLSSAFINLGWRGFCIILNKILFWGKAIPHSFDSR